MEEFNKCFIELEDVMLNNLLSQLRDCFDSQQNSFAYTCRGVYKIWKYCKGNYFKAKDNEYYNSYKLLAQFGFDKKAVNRYKNCYERFVYDYETDNNLPAGAKKLCKVCLKPEFEYFTSSKLFELLVLSEETALNMVVKGLITRDMTVKQIREVVKTVMRKDSEVSEVVEDTSLKEDEEEPEEEPFFNPNNHYERDFFENCNMEQLISICLSYQFEYEKLKKKMR